MELQANIRYNHMLKTVNSLVHCVVLTLINLFATISISAQTTWTGSTNSDWSTAANWSAGMPDTDRASSWGLWNSSGTFNNKSIITIGGSMSPSAKQLRNTALFNNTMGSTVILK